MPDPDSVRLHASQQRNAVTDLARDDPEEALLLAETIRDHWYRAQSLGWVARYAVREPTIGRAFHGARKAAELGKDAYQRSAPLAWALRAALETNRPSLAMSMFEAALAELPRIPLYCSRAYALEFLFPAAFPGGPAFRAPIIDRIAELCPATSHWRAGRLHAGIVGMLASVDADAARAFAERVPASKCRDRIMRNLAEGASWPPREFFW